MTAHSHWGITPRQSIEAECVRRGREGVVGGCARLILGDEADPELVLALAGPGARRVLDSGPRADLRYWLRVWGTRGLLWVWEDSATGALNAALNDPAWRVREMAAKVVARHLLGDALPVVAELRDDPVPRVREAAERTIARLTQASA
ncbi:MAG: HEAT repeat domain-containing protein [Micromonosporaceae bacterium]